MDPSGDRRAVVILLFFDVTITYIGERPSELSFGGLAEHVHLNQRAL